MAVSSPSAILARLRRGVPSGELGGTGAAAPPLILIGNPNVGKSVLFRNLTHRYVTVSNYPGTTVEIARATAAFEGGSEVLDTPGINDLSRRSDDARVTLELLRDRPDAVLVQVADAKNLRRALLLTLQLAELERPMVLVLNMADELAERGGSIDEERLAARLGIPVVSMVAVRKEGTTALVAALARARPAWIAGTEPAGIGGPAGRERLARVNAILTESYRLEPPEHASFRIRLGFWAMQPVQGFVLLAVVLIGVFWLVGLFAAGTLVDLLENVAFRMRLSPLAIRAVDALLPFPHVHATELITQPVGIPVTPIHEWTVTTLSREAVVPAYQVTGPTLGPSGGVARFFHDLLVGQFGIFTMAISYALAIVLPIVTTFFLVFSLLEDSGYFPRMAIMLNRSFRAMGLNGKAVLPMILGLGCDTMATMTTRILETKRDRIVTTLLLALAVPCSAQLGVLLALMTALSVKAAFLWAGIMVAVIFAVGWLSARLFGGERSDFLLEIPPLRRPRLGNVALKTVGRLEWYLKEVVPLFVLGTLFLFLLDKAHLLGRIARLGEPLVVGWLGLPADMTNAFLVGFLRRDFGAVYILDAATGPGAVLSPLQIFVAMVTITLFIPCFANVLMIAREHGTRIALQMAAFIFPFAFLVGGIVHFLGAWLGGAG